MTESSKDYSIVFVMSKSKFFDDLHTFVVSHNLNNNDIAQALLLNKDFQQQCRFLGIHINHKALAQCIKQVSKSDFISELNNGWIQEKIFFDANKEQFIHLKK